MTADATFERITYRPEGARRSSTIFLQAPADITIAGAPAVTGIEVDLFGDEKAPAGVDERRHVIAAELVSARVPMRMDLHYGQLVRA